MKSSLILSTTSKVDLEEDQLVNRIAYAEVPPRVEYELSEEGHSLQPMLKQMSDWGDIHQKKMEEQPEKDKASTI